MLESIKQKRNSKQGLELIHKKVILTKMINAENVNGVVSKGCPEQLEFVSATRSPFSDSAKAAEPVRNFVCKA